MKQTVYLEKRNSTKGWKSFLVVLFFMLVGNMTIFASSHREAPLIANDPLADNVDLYAFRSPDNPEMITIIATYVPLQLPYGGPNYYNFGENVRYEIHVDNDASVPGDEITYRFTFNIENEDPTTFFNIRLGQQNLKATYTLERSVDGGGSFQTIITDGVVPPNNIGPRSISGGAGLGTTYDALFNGGITTASSGEQVFAGPTDDPFFVDLGGIFDLGNAPRQIGEAVDNLACLNVSALAIQVPISTLLKEGAPAQPTNILDSDYVIGVWASASRPAMKTLASNSDPVYGGDWVQVSRLGMPLTNEAVIPIGQKDFWNALSPYDEIGETTLDEYFYNPELALYMDDEQFGGAVPAFGALRIQKASLGAFDFSNGGDGLFGLKGSDAVAGTALDDAVFGTLLLPAAGKPRSVDLWPAFHTGVPNVIPYQLATGKEGNPLAAGKPFVNNFLPNGGDMLRLNMAVPPTPRDDANFSSLGLVQAAAIGLTVAPFNTTADLEFIPNMDGFPNGRRLEDDVTRIELQAVAGVVLAAVGLWYDDYDPESSPSPVTQDLLNVLTYSTGVEKNDRAFSGSFPYLAMPFNGVEGCGAQSADGGATSGIDEIRQVYVSSNTQGRTGIVSVFEDKSFSLNSFATAAADADGIFYDEEEDALFQINRSMNVINTYGDLDATLGNGLLPGVTSTSTSDFINGREMGVAGDRIVISQDANDANGQTNKFYVYQNVGGDLTLDKTFDVDINLWGFHVEVNTVYAIVDNSNMIAVFEDFFTNDSGMITADRMIEVEGLGRTHGISYDGESDMMFLTDIGDAGSATDGGIITVRSFAGSIADNFISTAEQVKIEGSETFLGNPVDIGYDRDLDVIYVAERASGGGRILAFSGTSNFGNITPSYNKLFAGASALYVGGFVSDENPTTGLVEVGGGTIELNISPNPAADFLDVKVPSEVISGKTGSIEIYDVSGKKVMTAPFSTASKRLDISKFSNGMYVLNMRVGDFKNEVKFLKF